jgi:translation initiation factor 5B
VFNNKDPIVLGAKVIAGSLRMNTPLCVRRDKTYLGTVLSIEDNHKEVQKAKRDDIVAIKISGEGKLFGRHVFEEDFLVSRISRSSIDALVKSFRDEITSADVQLIKKLKQEFDVL